MVKDVFECVCLVFLPGEKTLGLKRISKMMLLTEPTSLQAARTALVDRESPAIIQKYFNIMAKRSVIAVILVSVTSTKSLLTSYCTFFKASVLLQQLPDMLSELAMSKRRIKKNVSHTEKTFFEKN